MSPPFVWNHERQNEDGAPIINAINSKIQQPFRERNNSKRAELLEDKVQH